MTKLETTPLDIRIRDMSLKRGVLSHKDVEKYLKELPDDSDRAEELVVYEEETESETRDETRAETETSEPAVTEEIEGESLSKSENTESS